MTITMVDGRRTDGPDRHTDSISVAILRYALQCTKTSMTGVELSVQFR